MFRTAPAAEPTRDAEPCAHPVPLAELERDLGGAPPEGWALHLGKRGFVIVPDDLGRDSVSRDDAKKLLDEARAEQVRRAARQAVLMREQEEADRVRLAGIWRGVPADMIPVGVSASSAMLQATQDAQPRRQSMVEAALGGGDSMVFHSLHDSGDES